MGSIIEKYLFSTAFILCLAVTYNFDANAEVGVKEPTDGVKTAITDIDNDGILDGSDNCAKQANADQKDTDNDGLGNVCDEDDDNDGVLDADDNCRTVANQFQKDTDADGRGNACDADDDNDGVEDELDNCPLIVNPNQYDRDNDGIGNACDVD